MIRLFEALSSSADGAFVVDEDLRIVYCNKAAEAILGFDREHVTGLFCYQLLHGHNEKRNLICKERCQVIRLAMKSIPVPSYDLQVTTKHGEKRWVNMSVITYKMSDSDGKKMIVHLFRDISQKKMDEIFFRRILETAQRYHKIPFDPGDTRESHHLIGTLTGREKEVLNLLATGSSTQEIAETLFISRNTARNHIQRILQKLQAHSRIEAVTYALHNGVLS